MKRDFRVLDYEYPNDLEKVVRMDDIDRIVTDETLRKRLENVSIFAIQTWKDDQDEQ